MEEESFRPHWNRKFRASGNITPAALKPICPAAKGRYGGRLPTRPRANKCRNFPERLSAPPLLPQAGPLLKPLQFRSLRQLPQLPRKKRGILGRVNQLRACRVLPQNSLRLRRLPRRMWNRSFLLPLPLVLLQLLPRRREAALSRRPLSIPRRRCPPPPYLHPAAWACREKGAVARLLTLSAASD